MSQSKMRSRLPRSSTLAVSHGARPPECARRNAHILPPSSLDDRKCFTQFDQMIHLSPSITRWTGRRKAAVVAAVHSGEITLEAACRRYELSIEEFHTWESKVAPRSTLPRAFPNRYALLVSIDGTSPRACDAQDGAVRPIVVRSVKGQKPREL